VVDGQPDIIGKGKKVLSDGFQITQNPSRAILNLYHVR